MDSITFSEFRGNIYNYFQKASDALMNIIDALLREVIPLVGKKGVREKLTRQCRVLWC